MIGVLAVGTKENIAVDVTDALSVVTDLSGSSPHYDVLDATDTYKTTAASATASGMVITVPLDVSNKTTFPAGEYTLFVTFTVGSQVIRKGPFPFTLMGA